jgi:hypothetical protein
MISDMEICFHVNEEYNGGTGKIMYITDMFGNGTWPHTAGAELSPQTNISSFFNS